MQIGGCSDTMTQFLLSASLFAETQGKRVCAYGIVAKTRNVQSSSFLLVLSLSVLHEINLVSKRGPRNEVGMRAVIVTATTVIVTVQFCFAILIFYI